MAITDYAGLTTAIQTNWLNRATDTQLTTVVPDLITLGEKRIYRKLRVRAMESAISSTVSGSGSVALPSDYVDLKYAYVNQAPVQWLDRKSAQWMFTNYPYRASNTGLPKFIARDGSNFIFGPAPDQSYLISGMYYARPVALSSVLNSIFTANPELFLFAALCEAEPWLSNDERIPIWEKKFGQILGDVQFEDDNEQHSGSILAVTAV
jgi:hypothetical protein